MKFSRHNIISAFLVLGITLFPNLGILSHSYVHGIDLYQGNHSSPHHPAQSDSNNHPDIDLKNMPDGIIQKSISKYLVEPIVLVMRNKESYFLNSGMAFHQKINPSPPHKTNPFLQPYFSHAPTVLF